jgi:hypothetical protein
MSYTLNLGIKRELHMRRICEFANFTNDFFVHMHSMMSKISCWFSEQVSEYLSLCKKMYQLKIYI